MSHAHWVAHEGTVLSFDADAVRTDGVVFMPDPGAGLMIGQFLAVWAVAWAVASLGHAAKKRLLATHGD